MQRGSTFKDLVTRSKKMKTYCNSDTWVKSYSILNFSNIINYMMSVLFACVWRNRERLPINGSRGLVGLVFLPLSTFVTRDIKFLISVVRWRLQFIAAALPRRVPLLIVVRAWVTTTNRKPCGETIWIPNMGHQLAASLPSLTVIVSSERAFSLWSWLRLMSDDSDHLFCLENATWNAVNLAPS
jgi:hypothetical protein